MVSPLPKWAMQRYAILWSTFKTSEFAYNQVSDALKMNDTNMISALISNLRKNGWISARLDAQDSRKRMYQLTSPEEAMKKMVEAAA